MKDVLPGRATRRAHAEAELSVFDTLEGSQLEDVRAWAQQHLPPDQPMERLIEAYIQAGGIPLASEDVRFYEITLATRWYRNALSGKNVEPPAQALERLLRITHRSMASQKKK
jgi:hypothetical protein